MIAVDTLARAEALYGSVRGCTRCALSKTRTHAVPGEGPLDSEILFIGEAPGMNEDKQGRPFVGAAGKFLEECLAEAGLTRETAYICNVLKCRPPSNRDPLPDEIAACRDYLDEQIAIVQPKVIVTLGRYSMARFFPQHTISKVHGRWKEIEGRYYVPMYHPAAALHQQSLRVTILEDFRRLPRILDRARAGNLPGLAPTPGAEPGTPPTAESGDTTQEPISQFRLFD